MATRLSPFTWARFVHNTAIAAPAKYLPRTHTCGGLSELDDGKRVVLNGWLQKPRRMGDDLIFAPLRDGFGTTQLVWAADAEASVGVRDALLSLSPESVISVEGVVRKRPSTSQKNTGTGAVEVVLQHVTVLNTASKLPFPVSDVRQVNEDLRLKYRYLDLRRSELQNNLRLRSKVSRLIRDTLYDQGFVEVETPVLFKSTPEGAREFLVPTRTPNKFYALAQSPQQYKQVLMSAGMDRYFQFAKCFRDENLRADRQPEFTQVDLEMSFVDPDQMYELVEKVVRAVWREVKGIDLPNPFPRMTYAEAISKYGSDKPDLRFGLEIHDISSDVAEWSFGALAIEAIKIPSHSNTPAIPKLLAAVSQYFDQLGENSPFKDGTIKVAAITSKGPEDFRVSEMRRRPLPRLSASSLSALSSRLQLQDGETAIVIIAPRLVNPGATAAGQIRTVLANELRTVDALAFDAELWKFLWVIDFPLFTPTSLEPGVAPVVGSSGLESVHHPFTAPHPDDAPMLFDSPTKVRSLHYDLVLNGMELGGGSIRIHDAQIQERVFRDILKLNDEETSRFHHLLDALRFGCPPHGGLALGFDRMMTLLCGASSLRDVIAFPKTNTGQELMVESPSAVTQKVLQMYHLAPIQKT